MDDLGLLLAHADDDQSAVLDGGLPAEAALSADISNQAEAFWDFSDDPNDLAIQRWGIIAPEGPDGDRLLELIQPLKKLREDEQDAEAFVFRAPVGMGTAAARDWRKKTFWKEGTKERDLPRYVLMLGDIDRTSLELQQVLASELLVGRLAFSTDEGYEAYVKKVLRWHTDPSPETQARALFFTARDQTAATTIGDGALVEPSLKRSIEERFSTALVSWYR